MLPVQRQQTARRQQRTAWRTQLSILHSLELHFNTESSTYTPRERKAMTAAFFPALRKIGCPPHVYSAILFAFFFFLRVSEYAKSANSNKKVLR